MAGGRNIKGITVEIDGNVTGLEKALKSVNKTISDTQKEQKDVERLLKLDPSNTELLSQKQEKLKTAIWKSDDYTSTTTDDKGVTTYNWLNDFEARFPDTDPPFEDPAQLQEFSTWMVSVDPGQATDSTLPSPVTYGDVTYTNDTATYRRAKFKAELSQYVELDSALFYYLFTELFLMVDSRAKNMFPSFIGAEIGEGNS